VLVFISVCLDDLLTRLSNNAIFELTFGSKLNSGIDSSSSSSIYSLFLFYYVNGFGGTLTSVENLIWLFWVSNSISNSSSSLTDGNAVWKRFYGWGELIWSSYASLSDLFFKLGYYFDSEELKLLSGSKDDRVFYPWAC